MNRERALRAVAAQLSTSRPESPRVAPAAPNWAVGKRVGPYEIGERIGSGGMAEVYVARARMPSGSYQRVALKRILPEFSQSARYRELFRREAEVSALTSHRNVARLLDFGEYDAEPVMALEFVDGPSCARLMRSAAAQGRHIAFDATVFIMSEVLSGLAHVHDLRDEHGRRLGIVHRDVSPGNVLISRAGEVKLTDFGIALRGAQERDASTGEVKGKFGYMAPEQAIGADVDRRSDLFALGVIFAELLLGRPLFGGKDDLERMTRAYDVDLHTLDRHSDGIPAPLIGAARRALARPPPARFADAREFAQALRQAAAESHVEPDEAALVASVADLLPLQGSGRYPLAELVGAQPPTRPGRAARPVGAVVPLPVPRCAASLDVAPAAAALEGLSLPQLIERVVTGAARHPVDAPEARGRQPLPSSALRRLLTRNAYHFDHPTAARAAWSLMLDRSQLPRMLFDIAFRGATGLLVAQDGERQKRIFFVQGAPRFVASTDPQELIGARLVAAGLVTHAQVDQALLRTATTTSRLGEGLLVQGALRAPVLLEMLARQIEDRVTELGAWRSGVLRFHEGERAGLTVPSCRWPMEELVVRMIRRHYGPAEIYAILHGCGPLEPAPDRAGRAGALDLTPGEARILCAIDGPVDVDRLVARFERAGAANAEVCVRALFIGLSAGLLRVASPGASETQQQ